MILLMLLGLAGAFANKENCLSDQYTLSGECCKQCPPGEGVVTPCGSKQTACAPCLDSETFSENFSHKEKCQPCTQCVGLMRMDTPCTDSNDATCVCNYGFYLNSLSQNCEPCTKCPEGQGMRFSCEADHDTVCEECGDDTYSDQESSWEPCIPCTTCDEDGGEIQLCTSITDTICRVPSVSPTPFIDYTIPIVDESPPNAPTLDGTTDGTPAATDGDTRKPIYWGLHDKLIPIYCSIPAFLIGLVAFIIFKKWNSCKQNKQGANNCTSQNQTPSPEGEKLHSDSGISVDSRSLQEQQGQSQLQTGITVDEEPCLLLPLHTREKVEQLIFRRSRHGDTNQEDDSDWCNLAGLLGYEEEHIATFRQEEHPVCALLSDWVSKEGSSLDSFCKALCNINRNDIAQSLGISPSGTKPTATSVV